MILCAICEFANRLLHVLRMSRVLLIKTPSATVSSLAVSYIPSVLCIYAIECKCTQAIVNISGSRWQNHLCLYMYTGLLYTGLLQMTML